MTWLNLSHPNAFRNYHTLHKVGVWVGWQLTNNRINTFRMYTTQFYETQVFVKLKVFVKLLSS